jgi:hypothetical protein
MQHLSAAPTSVSNDVAQQAAVDAVGKEMRDLNSSTNARLDQLNVVCSQLAQSVQGVENAVVQFTQRSPARAVQQDDRSLNVVVFGVPEDRSATIWRKTVDDAMEHVLDHAADVVDMFRPGRYDAGRVRPVIVKLRTAWDRRLLLANSRKLKDFQPQKLFLSADEPQDVRRKKSMEHLKVRAERDGKIAEIRNEVLFIDGRAVFSVKDGKIH